MSSIIRVRNGDIVCSFVIDGTARRDTDDSLTSYLRRCRHSYRLRYRRSRPFNPDFWVVFRPKPRSVLRNRQGIPRLSRVSSRAHEGKTRGWEPDDRKGFVVLPRRWVVEAPSSASDETGVRPRTSRTLP